jgi:hypothetical protein
MPEQVNTLEVYRLAMERKITLIPGQIFSPQRKFENCIRLNYSQTLSPRADAAVVTLGALSLSCPDFLTADLSVATQKHIGQAKLPFSERTKRLTQFPLFSNNGDGITISWLAVTQ